MEKNILEFLENKKILINTKTKARGHLGYFCNDKISISKNLSKEKQLQVLLHEYAHKIHSEIEPNNFFKGGSLQKLFQTTENLEEELLCVTNFVDENSKCLTLESMKNEYKQKTKKLETQIKQEFPDFAKSKKFKEYETYQRKTKCKSKYFLKYDHIKIFTPWLFKNEFYTLEKIDEDFPQLPKIFKTYFYLLSNYRKQKKVQNKISKLKRYYKKPTELFARFIEGILKDENEIKKIAPKSYAQYKTLANQGFYKDLPELIELIKKTYN